MMAAIFGGGALSVALFFLCWILVNSVDYGKDETLLQLRRM